MPIKSRDNPCWQGGILRLKCWIFKVRHRHLLVEFGSPLANRGRWFALLPLVFGLSLFLQSPSAVAQMWGGGFGGGFGGFGGGMIGGGIAGGAYMNMPMYPSMPGMALTMSQPWYNVSYPSSCYFVGYPFVPTFPYWPMGGYAGGFYGSNKKCCGKKRRSYTPYERTTRDDDYSPPSRPTPPSPRPAPEPGPIEPAPPPEAPAREVGPPQLGIQCSGGPGEKDECSEVVASAGCPDCETKLDSLKSSSVTSFRELADRFAQLGNNLAEGARKVMGVMYQNCEAPHSEPLNPFKSESSVKGVTIGERINDKEPPAYATVITNAATMGSTHPYRTRSPSSQPEVCKTKNASNMPLYSFAGRPRFENNEVVMNQKGKIVGGKNNPGLDCSGFWLAAMAGAGLSPSTTGYKHEQLLNHSSFDARTISQLGDAAYSCFSNVQFGSDTGAYLRSGDTIAASNEAHVMIVETVGPDPFGLKNKNKPEQCGDIWLDKFDFTVLQSSPMFGRTGVSRVEAKHLFAKSPALGQKMLNIAYNACLSKTGAQANTQARDGGMAIIRHKGETPECTLKDKDQVKFAGEACYEQCKEKNLAAAPVAGTATSNNPAAGSATQSSTGPSAPSADAKSESDKEESVWDKVLWFMGIQN